MTDQFDEWWEEEHQKIEIETESGTGELTIEICQIEKTTVKPLFKKNLE